MEIKGEFTFELPQEEVWKVLRDPKALAFIIPMLMDIKQTSDTEYTGALFFKVGSVAGTFHGKIELLNIREPDSYNIKVQGSSPIGSVNIEGGMYLEEHDSRTTMHYEGQLQFGGRIVSVGSRIIEVAIRALMKQSFETLDKYLVRKYKKV